MTSFSDPKGIIHTVTMFHIKAEFLIHYCSKAF